MHNLNWIQEYYTDQPVLVFICMCKKFCLSLTIFFFSMTVNKNVKLMKIYFCLLFSKADKFLGGPFTNIDQLKILAWINDYINYEM